MECFSSGKFEVSGFDVIGGISTDPTTQDIILVNRKGQGRVTVVDLSSARHAVVRQMRLSALWLMSAEDNLFKVQLHQIRNTSSSLLTTADEGLVCNVNLMTEVHNQDVVMVFCCQS